MLGFVFNLIFHLKYHASQLLKGVFKRVHREFSFLESSPGVKLSINKGLSLFFKVHQWNNFILNLGLDLRNFTIHCGSIRGWTIIVTNLSNEGTCIDYLKIRSDTIQIIVFGYFHSKRVVLNKNDFRENIVYELPNSLINISL